MDAKDIRNIQEAYMEVCAEVSESIQPLPREKMLGQIVRKSGAAHSANSFRKDYTKRGLEDLESKQREKVAKKASQIKKIKTKLRTHDPVDSRFREMENRDRGEKTQREEYDLYDIILSHLLDEGYAETEEAAHKIMVNMSEDWRESIVEARKKVKIDTQKPIEYKIADIGPGKKEYNVKTSKGWK
jgi:hypothetical protein